MAIYNPFGGSKSVSILSAHDNDEITEYSKHTVYKYAQKCTNKIFLKIKFNDDTSRTVFS